MERGRPASEQRQRQRPPRQPRDSGERGLADLVGGGGSQLGVSGALRGIGVASDKRNSAIPDVPTVKGVPLVRLRIQLTCQPPATNLRAAAAPIHDR